MAQLREVNKTLIGVVKQLESMRSTYRSLHRYEMPVGNPIEKNIKNISCQLAKLSGEGIKDNYDSSKGAGFKDRARKRELRVGERMELLDYAEKYNLEIDRDYYMGTYKSGQIISQLAGVSIYREEFQDQSADVSENVTDEEIAISIFSFCYLLW